MRTALAREMAPSMRTRTPSRSKAGCFRPGAGSRRSATPRRSMQGEPVRAAQEVGGRPGDGEPLDPGRRAGRLLDQRRGRRLELLHEKAGPPGSPCVHQADPRAGGEMHRVRRAEGFGDPDGEGHGGPRPLERDATPEP
jgi:hypothetical protein